MATTTRTRTIHSSGRESVSTERGPGAGLGTRHTIVNKTVLSAVMEFAFAGPPVAQDGCECGPTPNRKFT